MDKTAFFFRFALKNYNRVFDTVLKKETPKNPKTKENKKNSNHFKVLLKKQKIKSFMKS